MKSLKTFFFHLFSAFSLLGSKQIINKKYFCYAIALVLSAFWQMGKLKHEIWKHPMDGDTETPRRDLEVTFLWKRLKRRKLSTPWNWPVEIKKSFVLRLNYKWLECVAHDVVDCLRIKWESFQNYVMSKINSEKLKD